MGDTQTINVLKGLVIDGVNKAKSGHPGGAMSSMDFAYLLFTENLRFDPDDTKWAGRDRFILSAGHESMLIYSLLHMQGFLEKEELQNFRQLHSKTPGHPENFMTPGVECTTGPLGQGAAMSVGFAIAARHLGAKFGEDMVGQRIWTLLGDGCMQEGVTLGAASLAGHFRLPNLVWYYDKNKIQISGAIDRTCSDDVESIFKGFGWSVLTVNGHNHEELRTALAKAKGTLDRPLLIVGDTTMGHGCATLEGLAATHGSPLPAEERLLTKKRLEIPDGEDFHTPATAVEHFRRNFATRREEVRSWKARLEKKRQDASFSKLWDHCFVEENISDLPNVEWDTSKPMATRSCFGRVLEAWADHLPNLMGGSADLEPSNMTGWFAKKTGDFTRETPGNRNLAFGVREFPMSAICNGMALYGGVIPFDATFLSFADYSRPALRLGAIQKARVIHEFTHDSFYLGEDGPTHQPVEHVMSLRLIPNFYVMRPADGQETEVMMQTALGIRSGSAICLSRQNLPYLDITPADRANIARGAWDVTGVDQPDLILIATGSEVHLALKVAEKIKSKKVRVVSMPCQELFDEQDSAWREALLPAGCPRISIEAGSTLGWQKYTGQDGLNIGIDHYGASAPAGDLEKEYGFTPDAVLERISKFL